MADIHFICKPYKDDEKSYLALQFFKQIIENHPYLEEFYRMLVLKMEKFTIKNERIDQLKYSVQNGWHMEINYCDIMGILRPMIVIKKLKRDHCTYEIRINGESDKTRILFFHTDIQAVENLLIILSYGYNKNRSTKDMTNELANSTESIKLDIETHRRPQQRVFEWIGVDN